MSAACGQDTSVAVAVTHILRYLISSWRRAYACAKCSCDTKVNYLSQAVLDVLGRLLGTTHSFRASLWLLFASATKCHLPLTFVLWRCGWKLQHMCWHRYSSHVYRLASTAEPSLGPNLPDHGIVFHTPSTVWFCFYHVMIHVFVIVGLVWLWRQFS